MGNQTNVTLAAFAGFIASVFWWLAGDVFGIQAPALVQNGSIVGVIVAIQFLAPKDFLAIFKKP